MRCSRFAYTLLSIAMAAGCFGIASVDSRMGVAAEQGAISTFGKAVNRFESVKEWRTMLVMDELINFRSRKSFLLPAIYKIAITEAVDYASKVRVAIDGESLSFKTLFSPQMMKLLSTRWADKYSTDSNENANFNRDTDGYLNDSSGDFSNNSAGASSTNSTADSAADSSANAATDSGSTFKYDPRYKGSFGYPYHGSDSTSYPEVRGSDNATMWQSRYAALNNNPFNLFEGTQYANSVSDYESEGNAVTESYSMNDGYASAENPGTEASENTEQNSEVAENPVGEDDGFFTTDAENNEVPRTNIEAFLNKYLGSDIYLNPMSLPNRCLSYNGIGNTFNNLIPSIEVNSDTAFFNITVPVPGLGISDNSLQNEPNDSSGGTIEGVQENQEYQDVPITHQNSSGTLLEHFADWIKSGAKGWSAAFQRTTAHFSAIRELF